MTDEELFEQALDVYYAAEELLAQDPANAPLAAHVTAMRAAYEEACGEPIPAREEGREGGLAPSR